MGDVNQEISAIDEFIPEDFGDVNNGFALGADVGVDIREQWRIGIHYRRLFAGSDVFHEDGPYSFSVNYDVPAHAVSGSIGVNLASRNRFGPRISVSGGIVIASGTYQDSSGLQTVSRDLQDIGPYLDANLSVDLHVGPQAAFVPLIGYRSALVTVSEVNQPDVELDYSGFMMTVSLKIDLAGH